jgi:hypothetical protein
MASGAAPGWFPDPARRYRLRYWDGHQWTAWATDGDQPTRDAGPRRPTIALLLASGIGAVVAMPFAVWWLVGDQSETNLRPRDQLDYGWHAPAVSETLTAIVGSIALVMVTLGVVVFVVAARRHLLDRRWLLVLATFLIGGALLGWIGRAVTAGVIGANIGGGMALVFVLPIAVLLIGYATAQAMWLIVNAFRPKAAP